jgi:hypothetical protein
MSLADLSSPTTVTVPTATKIIVSPIVINSYDATVSVTYRWIDSSGNAIYAPGKPGTFDTTITWSGTDYTDIFGFVIRQQDVGVKIGIGLRKLIIIKLKRDVPILTNVDITFND